MISLAEKYYLVVGDRFELFFRGVIKKHNPYLYYIIAECEKGFTYNRYFTYTPTKEEVGEYILTIKVLDDEGNVIEQKDTTLIVNEVSKAKKPLNILCIGDSETVNGVWPYVGYNKYNDIFPNLLNFIGKMKKEEIGYEGYGGWQWKTFFDYEIESRTSSLIIYGNFNLSTKYLNTRWESSNLEFILIEIKDSSLKFKRGSNNTSLVNPTIGQTIKCIDHDVILEISKYEYVDANPFWNSDTKEVDFIKYIKDNNFEQPDLVFTFLTGNGLYMPYSTEFTNHKEYAPKFIEKLHKAFPHALIGIMGIEQPCCNGGVTACYGASGYYHDWYGYALTAFNYDEWLDKLCNMMPYSGYTVYFDTKAQFDSEYNYPVEEITVNNRSKIVERIGVNGLHPSMDGYLQIGDAFYRFLVEMIKKVNNLDN